MCTEPKLGFLQTCIKIQILTAQSNCLFKQDWVSAICNDKLVATRMNLNASQKATLSSLNPYYYWQKPAFALLAITTFQCAYHPLEQKTPLFHAGSETKMQWQRTTELPVEEPRLLWLLVHLLESLNCCQYMRTHTKHRHSVKQKNHYQEPRKLKNGNFFNNLSLIINLRYSCLH